MLYVVGTHSVDTVPYENLETIVMDPNYSTVGYDRGFCRVKSPLLQHVQYYGVLQPCTYTVSEVTSRIAHSAANDRRGSVERSGSTWSSSGGSARESLQRVCSESVRARGM